MTIGERIAFFRKRYKINQKTFADLVGVSQSHISKIENNQDNPSDRLLQKIIATWDLNKEWVLNGVGEIVDDDATIQITKSQCFTAINDYMKKYGESSTNELFNLILKMIHIAESLNYFVDNQTFDGIDVLSLPLDAIQKLLDFWTEESKKNDSALFSVDEGEMAYKEFTEITEIYYKQLVRSVDKLNIRITANMKCFSKYFDKEIDEYLEQHNSHVGD